MEQETKNASHARYAKLKKKIQEVHPLDHDPNECVVCGRKSQQPTRLADVLLAMNKLDEIAIETLVGFLDQENKWAWNLKDDNLDHQSDECKDFLIKLLVDA